MGNDLSITQYAALHGRDRSNAHKLVLQGRIPARKIGTQWVIPADTPFSEGKRVKSGKYKGWRKRGQSGD